MLWILSVDYCSEAIVTNPCRQSGHKHTADFVNDKYDELALLVCSGGELNFV